MGQVLLELSMSLDGYIAGPDVTPDSAAESHDFEDEHFRDIGALIIGRRMADVGIGPWGEEASLHAPVFVVTNRPTKTIVKQGGTSYIFVTDGIDDALRQARAAAGSNDVLVNGGADVARQYLKVGPSRNCACT